MTVGQNDLAGATWRQELLSHTGGYVALKEAWELSVRFQKRDDGIAMIMDPLPVPPFGMGGSRIVVRADMLADLSGEKGLVQYHRQMTGRSSLVLPNSVIR